MPPTTANSSFSPVTEGGAVGFADGSEGCVVGTLVGETVGSAVGLVGRAVGALLGSREGEQDGTLEGDIVGEEVEFAMVVFVMCSIVKCKAVDPPSSLP